MKECCKLIGSELYVSDNYAINGSVSDLALVRCQAEVWTWSLFILLVYSQWVLYFSMYLLCALFFVDGYFIGISLKWIEARTFCFADAMTVNIAQMVEISCIFCLCILLPCWSIVVLKIKYSWILNQMRGTSVRIHRRQYIFPKYMETRYQISGSTYLKLGSLWQLKWIVCVKYSLLCEIRSQCRNEIVFIWL